MLRIWNLKGKLELIDLDSNWYIAWFELANDCREVPVGGPWKLFDNIIPQRWKLDYELVAVKLDKMAMWVRLLGLPYFRENILKIILEQIGTLLKLDKNTA